MRNRWDPFSDLAQVQKRMNQLFESALARTDFEAEEGFDSWTPVCDVWETERGLEIFLELPGMEQDQIELRMDADELVVSGERRLERDRPAEQFHRVERSYGKFSRRFRIPSTVDRAGVQASFRQGVLRVTLPAKQADQPESVRVDIR